MKTEIENETDKPPEIDPIRLQMFQDQLRSEQNLAVGVIAGAVAAVACAAVWALITSATSYQIGFMAIGVGYAVGWAIGTFGKGLSIHFGVAGAVLALAGCLMGNVLTACILVSKEYGVPLSTVITGLNLENIATLLVAWFSPMDLLFYGLAIYGGYRMAFRKVSESEIEQLIAT